MKKSSYAHESALAKIIMHSSLTKGDAFAAYQEKELTQAKSFATRLGYTLDRSQVHLSGERFLMSGKKLVLTGTRISDGDRVILKFSTDAIGRQEIAHEHYVDKSLNTLNFAAHTFLAPKEYCYHDTARETCRVIAYIPEDQAFNTLPTNSQFLLAKRAFDVQSGLHATTYGHIKDIARVFGFVTSDTYLEAVRAFMKFIGTNAPQGLFGTELVNAQALLVSEARTIEMYGGFLTHTDFVPHNMRLHEGELYLIDQTSLHFGNKHEGTARFINYMELYNPTVADYFLRYIRDNRALSEYSCLKLMRLYKLIYLLAFYTRTHSETEGDLKALSLARLKFWQATLIATQNDQLVPAAVRTAYQRERDRLRDEAEKVRQRELGQL